MTKPRLLLFDLGNVLVRFDPDMFSKTLGRGAQDAHAHYELGMRELTNRYEAGKCSTGEYFDLLRRFLQNAFDLPTIERAFLSVLTDPIPGMEDLVHRATLKVPAAVVSNTNETHFSSVAHRIRALSYLPKRYLSYQIGVIKPSREFYQYIIRQEQVKPGEMLFIDDVKENIEAAQTEGIVGHRFQNAEELERKLKELGVL